MASDPGGDTIRCEVRLEITRPPSEVFAFVDDLGRAPRWLSQCAALRETSPPPRAVGTTLHYTYKDGGGPGTMVGAVTTYEKERRLEMRFTDAMFDVEVGFRFEPAGAGTRFEHAIVITPKAAMIKAMAPMIRAATQTQIAQDTARLKQLLEAGD